MTVKLHPDEMELLKLSKVKVAFSAIFSWSLSIYDVVITDKRIILVTSFLPFLNPKLSIYYNRHHYEKYAQSINKIFGNIFLEQHSTGKGRFLGNFIKLQVRYLLGTGNIKIYTDKNDNVFQLIEENKLR